MTVGSGLQLVDIDTAKSQPRFIFCLWLHSRLRHSCIMPGTTIQCVFACEYACVVLPLLLSLSLSLPVCLSLISPCSTFTHPSSRTHPLAFLSLHLQSQATGVVVGEDVSYAFNEFKLQRGEFKLRYFIYAIENKKSIVIEKKGEREKTYEDFVADLPENDCRYGLIDLEFETDDGRPTSKIVFISWNPDTASVRPKMLYSGSKEAIKSVLTGVGIHINATDYSELDLEASILPVVKKFA